jgi:hypothetical protein
LRRAILILIFMFSGYSFGLGATRIFVKRRFRCWWVIFRPCYVNFFRGGVQLMYWVYGLCVFKTGRCFAASRKVGSRSTRDLFPNSESLVDPYCTPFGFQGVIKGSGTVLVDNVPVRNMRLNIDFDVSLCTPPYRIYLGLH